MDIDFRVIVLIIFLVVSAIQWLGKKMKGGASSEEGSGISESLEDIYEQYREEIRQQQTEVQEDIQVRSEPPPMPRVEPDMVDEPVTLDHFKLEKPTLSEDEKLALEKFKQLNGNQKKVRRSSQAGLSIKELLANPQSAKQAVILTEILGQPKSMQTSSY